MNRKKLLIVSILVFFTTGCSHQKTPIGTTTFQNFQGVKVRDGTVFLLDANKKETAIATSTDRQSIDSQDEHFGQYTYTSASVSPDKQFVALFAEGWETSYLRIYDVQTKSIREVSASGLCPTTYAWTDTNLLKGEACSCTLAYCGEAKKYISTNTTEPWKIIEIVDADKN